MPLAGTVCCKSGVPTSFESCLCSARDRSCLFPLPLLTEMAKNDVRRERAGISATTLLQCPRQTALKWSVDYYESPADYHARWRGTGVHAMAGVDGGYRGIIQERRIRKVLPVRLGQDGDVHDLEITGQPDWFDTENGHLDDWKSTSKCPTTPYDDHKLQVNIYAWLLDGGTFDDTGERCDYHVETASIIYIDPSRSVQRSVELLSNEAIERELVRRAGPLANFQITGELPDGVDTVKDRWKQRFCPFRGTGACCGDE